MLVLIEKFYCKGRYNNANAPDAQSWFFVELVLPAKLILERSYSFSLANGDQLIALWTDGIAVEDDPGVEATLILNDSSNRKAIGVDVLYGFEQQMMTDTEDENLIIHDLLVKDYPIMLRLTSTKNIFLPIVLKSYTH